MDVKVFLDWLRRRFGERVDWYYEPESEVRRVFNVPPDRSACDAVFHAAVCGITLVEEKSRSGVGKAVKQLRACAVWLRSLDYDIRRLIILIEVIPASEARRFRVRKRDLRLMEKRGGEWRPVLVLGRPVYAVFKKALGRRGIERWL